MRTTQYIGFNVRANLWLKANVGQRVEYTDVIHRTFPDGHTEILPPTPITSWDQKPTGENVLGMFEEEIIPVMEYRLKDGRIVVEFEQASPWSSGPCIFMALKWADTGEFIEETLWAEDEIQSYL